MRSSYDGPHEKGKATYAKPFLSEELSFFYDLLLLSVVVWPRGWS